MNVSIRYVLRLMARDAARRLSPLVQALVIAAIIAMPGGPTGTTSGSASNQSSATTTVSVGAPSGAFADNTLLMLNADRIAISFLGNDNLPGSPLVTPSAVNSDCTLLVRAYDLGQLFTRSTSEALKAAGKALFASIYDLMAYGCFSPHMRALLHPTDAQLTREVIRGGTAVGIIVKILGLG